MFANLKWTYGDANWAFQQGYYLYVTDPAEQKIRKYTSGSLNGMKRVFRREEGEHVIFIPDEFNVAGRITDVVDALYMELGKTNDVIRKIYEENILDESIETDKWLLTKLGVDRYIDADNIDEEWVAGVVETYNEVYKSARKK